MVDRRLSDRDWEGVKEAEIAPRYCQFASNWGQITPGRQICWIYYLDLFDSLPALLLLLLCESVRWKSVSKKKENGFHNKDRKPTASHAVWWMSAELHKNVQKNATTLSRCNANTQELKSDCSIGPSPKTNKDWLMIFGFWEPLALRRWILRFKWMADFFG